MVGRWNLWEPENRKLTLERGDKWDRVNCLLQRFSLWQKCWKVKKVFSYDRRNSIWILLSVGWFLSKNYCSEKLYIGVGEWPSVDRFEKRKLILNLWRWLPNQCPAFIHLPEGRRWCPVIGKLVESVYDVRGSLGSRGLFENHKESGLIDVERSTLFESETPKTQLSTSVSY